MLNYHGWIVRALLVRYRQPNMKPQRRFMAVVAVILTAFLIGATLYLFRQPPGTAMEVAALHIFLALGILIAILVAVAVVVAKRTSARWSYEEALTMAGLKDDQTPGGQERREP